MDYLVVYFCQVKFDYMSPSVFSVKDSFQDQDSLFSQKNLVLGWMDSLFIIYCTSNF